MGQTRPPRHGISTGDPQIDERLRDLLSDFDPVDAQLVCNNGGGELVVSSRTGPSVITEFGPTPSRPPPSLLGCEG
jgi:hypothetical protein